MKIFRIVLLLSAALIFSAVAEKPNVIILLTDDQGYGDVSAHGNPVLKTPELDKLHAESVRLTDFHVAPMCTPTRGQLMTGTDAMRNGATAVCQGRSMMRNDIKIMPQYFADAGYATGIFGKWHMGDSYPHRPRHRGFQEALSFRAWGITSLADYWENQYFDPMLMHNGVDTRYEGYCTDIFFDEAMKWINKCKGDKKPFFLYLPTNTPHVPEVVADKYSAPYQGTHEDKPIPDKFYGMIANIDENLGKLESFLRERGLRDNTILIFMSDNGTQNGRAKDIYNAGMRDKKTSVHEGGHRVPCFIRWIDGKLQHGKDIAELTEVQDILPTLAEFCGLNLGEATLDGTNLAGLLSGREKKLADRMCVVQYKGEGEMWQPSVVMWNKWRLVGEKKLYNIETDPHQDRDVYDQFPEVSKRLTDHYIKWYASAKPLYDERRWIVIGSPKANKTILYASDWQGSYCDNRGGLTAANGTGYWDLIVEKTGSYELELRRWPRESGKTLTEGYRGVEDKSRSARPIAAANIQINDANYTLDTPSGTKSVIFTINLAAGKTQLHTALMDSDDRTLCSAMYVYVKRMPEGSSAKLTPASERKPKGSAATAAGRKPVKAPKQAQAVKLQNGDILLADFEGKDYTDWQITGTAFGKGPTVTKERVIGHQGSRLADTFIINGSDKPVGTLTSPAFKINKKYLNFLVGGGKHPGRTAVNLLIDGVVVKSATGNSTKNPQGRKVMQWVSWDISKWQDKEAQVQIVDQVEGGWGHIMVDQIFLSDRGVE